MGVASGMGDLEERLARLQREVEELRRRLAELNAIPPERPYVPFDFWMTYHRWRLLQDLRFQQD